MDELKVCPLNHSTCPGAVCGLYYEGCCSLVAIAAHLAAAEKEPDHDGV